MCPLMPASVPRVSGPWFLQHPWTTRSGALSSLGPILGKRARNSELAGWSRLSKATTGVGWLKAEGRTKKRGEGSGSAVRPKLAKKVTESCFSCRAVTGQGMTPFFPQP